METFAASIERLRELLAQQIEGYRRLLETTRESTRAGGGGEVGRFERLLMDQAETLRRLKNLERERRHVLREVGPPPRAGIEEMEAALQRLAVEVSRANRVERLVIERNGALVEARIALLRRAGAKLPSTKAGIDHRA